MKIVKIAATIGVCAALAISLSACGGASGTSGSKSDAGASASGAKASSSQSANAPGSQAKPSTAGDVSVKLSMVQEVTVPETNDSPLQFAEEDININAPAGSSVLEVLKASGRKVKTTGEGDSLEVVAIGGLENGAAGAGSHWTYEINGVAQKTSPEVRYIESNAELTFKFVK